MSLALRRSHGARWEQSQSSGQLLPVTHTGGKMLNGHFTFRIKTYSIKQGVTAGSFVQLTQTEELTALTGLKIRSKCSVGATGCWYTCCLTFITWLPQGCTKKQVWLHKIATRCIIRATITTGMILMFTIFFFTFPTLWHELTFIPSVLKYCF